MAPRVAEPLERIMENPAMGLRRHWAVPEIEDEPTPSCTSWPGSPGKTPLCL